jgi:hypothetical protein
MLHNQKHNHDHPYEKKVSEIFSPIKTRKDMLRLILFPEMSILEGDNRDGKKLFRSRFGINFFFPSFSLSIPPPPSN